MTAYGAVISLNNTIRHTVFSSRYSLVRPCLEILQLVKELHSLRKILKRLDDTRKSKSRKKVNALDGRIKDLIWELEDSWEFLLTDQILSQSESPLPGQVDGEMKERVWEFQGLLDSLLFLSLQSEEFLPYELEPIRKFNESEASQSRSLKGERFSIDLQPLQDDVGSFINKLKDMERDYIYELENMAEDEEASSSIIGFSGTDSKMIGLSDQFKEIIGFFTHNDFMFGRVVKLVGMAGIGKTTLAKKLYQDPQTLSFFECRAWVTIGRKPQSISQLSQGILAQLCGITHIQRDEVSDYLKDKKCLIVVDDVWEQEVLDSLMQFLLNIQIAGIRILVTAREKNATGSQALFFIGRLSLSIVVPFLSKEESKDLLCKKVFGEQICPPQLEKAATKIAENCEGLPLMIVTVADFLSKSQNRDPDYWNDVAEKRNSVFTDAYNEISKVLFPNYDYLPQFRKMPFLYMGVFPPKYDTPISKIINMLAAEGWFLDTNETQTFEDSVWGCLAELCEDRNLVLFKRKSVYWNDYITCLSMLKTCRLHSSWRHVCRGEASKNKFYRVLNKLIDVEEEGVKGQRGLCLENNILFGIKQFYDSVSLDCASSTRSLMFIGPYHQYPTPIDVGFKLLRELDALKLRFYTFPTELLTLVQLKYLALTCNGQLPTTISKLFNLRVLIIHPHINIKQCGVPSYVPLQIWDMQELEHIEILGKSLAIPHHVASLEKLLTLVGVNANIGTILELSTRIPNIRKLVVQIELMPDEGHNDLLSCFRCISTLESLETLKFSIINPAIQYEHVSTQSSLMLPRGLKKLYLSGMGFPWEYVNVIGSLPDLEVLKLRSYAFRGPTWEVQEEGFLRLTLLLIEDSDLVQWKLRSESFSNLAYLGMKHCYKLQELDWPVCVYKNSKIELVDCNPLALACVKQFQPGPIAGFLDVTVSSSFDKKPTTINFRIDADDSRAESDEDIDEQDEIENDDDEDIGEDDEEEDEEENDEEECANRGEDDQCIIYVNDA